MAAKIAQHDEAVVDLKKLGEPGALAIIQAFSLGDFVSAGVEFYKTHPVVLKDELLSGITVAVMQVPESVAFSFVAGVDPIVGLYST